MTQVLAQENFKIEAYGDVKYPEGTRILRVIVPPGVAFNAPVGVLVEEIQKVD